MLTVLGYVCLFLGTQLYERYLKEVEYRRLIIIDALISIVIAPISFAFVLRWNVQWGIPDLVMIIFTETVGDIISQCFIFLPMCVLFTKITPKKIEGTCFALLAGISNFRGTIRGWTGSQINTLFVGVTQTDLSRYWILVAISCVCSFLPLIFISLIPSRTQIEAL